MEQEKQLRPPYATSGVADKVLDLFVRMSPKKIDIKFIVENNIATPSNAFRAIDLLRWLGIIDKTGNVKEDLAKKLRLVGDEKNQFLADLIKSSYRELIERVDLSKAKKDDVINFFVHNYNTGNSQAIYSAALFLHLCHKFKIPVSDDLKKKTHTSGVETKKRDKRISDKLRDKISKSEDKFENRSRGSNKYKVSISGENANYDFLINSLSDMEDMETIFAIIKKKLS